MPESFTPVSQEDCQESGTTVYEPLASEYHCDNSRKSACDTGVNAHKGAKNRGLSGGLRGINSETDPKVGFPVLQKTRGFTSANAIRRRVSKGKWVWETRTGVAIGRRQRVKGSAMKDAEKADNKWLDTIKAEQDKWEKSVCGESLARAPEKRSEFRTGSGEFVVKRVYTPLDVADIDFVRDIGFPGSYPYTRGVDLSGLRARDPGLGFYAGFGTSEDANERYKTLIAHGARSITLAIDLPTQCGYDSDHPMARGEVGKVGVAIDTVDDMERIFDGIPLERISTGTVGNCIGPIMVALFYALGERRGIPPGEMRVSLQNDPLKEYTGRGTYIFPVRPAVHLAADVVEFCMKNLPHWGCQYVCSTQTRWGGATASQEIGFGIATLVAYIEAALERGVRLEEFVPKLNLHGTADNDLFEEVAKYRAARRLWAKIASERFGTTDRRVLALRTSAWTGSHRLTAQQPLTNIVRTTLHVLACMLTGMESTATPAYDEALALPTVESTRLAHLTSHIIHHEGMVGNTADPLGGSYYVESLTSQMEEKAREWFDKVQDMGGAVVAIEQGYYQKEMADGMARYQRQVEDGDRVVIGVNRHQLEEELPIEIFAGDPEAERRQVERLKRVRQERDNTLVRDCLAGVKAVAEEKAKGGSINTVPPILDAIKACATVGEICDVLRSVFGEYKPSLYF